ncbi:MAG: hypothetical protein ABIH38_03380 [Patescibacteria group bacterium]
MPGKESLEGREIPPDLSALDLNSLQKEAEEYNHRFNAGTMMADMLKAHVRNEELPPQKATDREPPLERIKLQYADLIGRTGISLETIGTNRIFGADGERQASELRFNLSDRNKFIEYLKSIPPENLSPSQAEGLKTVAESLTTQLAQEYQVTNPKDERMIELLGGLKEMNQAYDRLDPEKQNGLSRAVERLKKYDRASQGKHLKEYIAVEKAGLMAEVGGRNFGPSQWHTDATPEFYEEHWQQALEILKSLGDNPQAQNLQDQVRENLKASLAHARENLERNEESHLANSREAFFLQVISRAEKELAKI